MMIWQFTIVLKQSDIDLDAADRLYARCDDSTLITDAGISYLEFDREALSLQAAIKSAVSDIHEAGFDVERVELGQADLTALARVF